MEWLFVCCEEGGEVGVMTCEALIRYADGDDAEMSPMRGRCLRKGWEEGWHWLVWK